VPDDHEGSERPLSDAAQRVASEHHTASAEAVGEHPAGEKADDRRGHNCGQDQPELRRAATIVKDGERDRDGGHTGPKQRGGIARKETPKIRLLEQRQLGRPRRHHETFYSAAPLHGRPRSSPATKARAARGCSHTAGIETPLHGRRARGKACQA